mgnify:CR=1 FL=1
MYPVTMEENPSSDDGAELLKEYVKKFSKSGGSSGVALHFDAEIADQFHLDPDTEVNVQVCESQGDVYFRIGAPTGYTSEKFRSFAEEHGWTRVDLLEDMDGEWYATYKDRSGTVTIEMDSRVRIDDALINNITIKGQPVPLDEDTLDQYSSLCVGAQQKGLDVQIDDSKGLWSQLDASIRHDTDDAPDLETLKQIVTQSEEVTATLVSRHTSVHTTLSEIADIVHDIRDVMDGFHDEDGSIGDNTRDDGEDPTADEEQTNLLDQDILNERESQSWIGEERQDQVADPSP